MASQPTLRAELQEQRRLIEDQRIEIRRQRRQLEVQFRRTADMQGELDNIKAILFRGLPTDQPTPASPSDGRAAWPPWRTTFSSNDGGTGNTSNRSRP